MNAAKAAGAVVSMDLASFELVRNCQASLADLVESKCLDIVFANESEVEELARVLGLLPDAGGTLITCPWVSYSYGSLFLG